MILLNTTATNHILLLFRFLYFCIQPVDLDVITIMVLLSLVFYVYQKRYQLEKDNKYVLLRWGKL